MEEIWIDVKGYEGFYQVSSTGRLRSLDRIGQDGRILKGKIKVKNDDPYGFTTIKFYSEEKENKYGPNSHSKFK
ncbi:NUMOD4 domain-containing protein [Bacillus mycoides]|uniref:NUMOD4 domain-containing protein n=1 Tax=Bacillus mycoides TaxID=1405 RepID=UPI0035CC3D95